VTPNGNQIYRLDHTLTYEQLNLYSIPREQPKRRYECRK
jgi:hypothetical protein